MALPDLYDALTILNQPKKIIPRPSLEKLVGLPALAASRQLSLLAQVFPHADMTELYPSNPAPVDGAISPKDAVHGNGHLSEITVTVMPDGLLQDEIMIVQFGIVIPSGVICMRILDEDDEPLPMDRVTYIDNMRNIACATLQQSTVEHRFKRPNGRLIAIPNSSTGYARLVFTPQIGLFSQSPLATLEITAQPTSPLQQEGLGA